jgi:hypothetical protein
MWPMLPFLNNLPDRTGYTTGTNYRPGEYKGQETTQAAPAAGGDEQGSATNGNGDGGASGRHAPTAMETVGAFYKAYYDALWLAETVSPILDLPLGPDWASGSLQLAYWQMAFEWSSSTGLYFSPLGGSVPRTPIAFNANLNWALQTTPPTPQQKRNYIEGIGYGVTAYNGIGAGVMRVPGTGTYVQIGIGSPGLSFGASYTIPKGTPAQPSMSMVWRWMWFVQTGH